MGLNPVTGRVTAAEPPVAAETAIVGMRVAELPVPFVASEQRLCCTCSEPIWLARHDRALARLVEAGARTIYLPCASADGRVPDLVITSRTALEQAWLASMTPVSDA